MNRFYKFLVLILSVLVINPAFTQNGLSFDGVNDGVDCGNNSLLQITGTAITLEAWIYPTAWTNEVWRGGIVVKEQNSSNSGFMLRAGDNGKLNFAIGSTGSWTELTTVASTLTLNTWQHVAASYDGAKMRLYLNGLPIDSLATTVSISGTASTNLNIGAHIPMNRYFIGRIDEVRVWDIARTSSEILLSYNAEQCQQSGLVAYYRFNQGIINGANGGVTTLVDSSGNALDGTLLNFTLSGTTSNWITGATLTPSGSNTGVDVQNACSPFIWIDGNSYTANNNTATHTIPNSAGCDSVVTLNLTLNGGTATYSTDVISTCGPIFWLDGNLYFSNNNTATFTTTNTNGCDSIITLDLTVYATENSTEHHVSCDPFTWIDGNTYTTDNTSATYTFTNIYGCDSIVNLDLDIAITYGTDIRTTCGPLTWIDGNTYLPGASNIMHTIIDGNSQGCDSIVTLDLTYEPIDLTTSVPEMPVLTANQANATYQWLDCLNGMAIVPGATNQTYVATQIGTYAVEVTYLNCTDTSNCISVTSLDLQQNEALDLKVFPNPTSGAITIELGESFGESLIVVRDVTGRVINQLQSQKGSNLTIELGKGKGLYFVEVTSESGKHIAKVLKQ